MPEPLPLAELLETLKAKGLPIGVREHLAVGRLLSRWDDTDTGSLRIALAALLARNPDEVALVRTSFDTLYGAPEPEEPKAHTEPEKAGHIPIPRRWIAAGVAALLAVAIVVTALLWPRPAKNSGHQQIPTGSQAVPKEAPPPPVIPDTYPRPAWSRSFAVAGGVAAVLFLWMYGTRLGREARRRARRRWSEEADALPGPHGYDLNLGDLAPPFSAAVLDDVATLLGRHAADPPRGGELDVNRTLERTIRAGLAPLPVFRSRASQNPLIVLEDVGAEMRPWRGTVRAFLKGLEARGVALDRWRFDGDAGRIFRSPGDPVLSLKQLVRLRPESPLLVISTGEGLLEGQAAAPAAWIETLRGWRSRAWLQPVTDPGYWRPVLRTVPLHVWPMTPEGLLTTARQLAHGDLGRPVRESARAFSDRPVTALDIERLRWLVSLAPRRDPDLAEQLRQRFCPHVPPAALLDALEMPAPANPPQIGPSAADVHAFLLEVLDRSRPEPGSAAFERWRLDRTLQELRIPGGEPGAVRELAELAQGPLAGDVETAVEAVTGVAREARGPLKRQVLRAVRRRAAAQKPAEAHTGSRSIRRRTWPDAVEIGTLLVCVAALGAALPPKARHLVLQAKGFDLTNIPNCCATLERGRANACRVWKVEQGIPDNCQETIQVAAGQKVAVRVQGSVLGGTASGTLSREAQTTQRTPVTAQRYSKTVEVEWDCTRTNVAQADYSLAADEEYVTAKLELDPPEDYLYTSTPQPPVYDQKRRRVTGSVTFEENPPSDGSRCAVSIRLAVTVRVYPKSGA